MTANKIVKKPRITTEDMLGINDVKLYHCRVDENEHIHYDDLELECEFINIKNIPIASTWNMSVDADYWIFVKKGENVAVVFKNTFDLIAYLNGFLKTCESLKDGNKPYGYVKLLHSENLERVINELNSTHQFMKFNPKLKGYKTLIPRTVHHKKSNCGTLASELSKNFRKML